MILETITLGTIIAINTGLTELTKKINPKEKYTPIVALLIGVLLLVLYSFIPKVGMTLVESIIFGLMTSFQLSSLFFSLLLPS